MTINDNKNIENLVNYVKIVDKDKHKILRPPSSGFGEHTIIWKDGKVQDVIIQKRVRIE